MLKMRSALVGAIACTSVLFALSPRDASASIITDNWSFNGTNTGSGSFTYDDTSGLVSSFTGSYNGNALTFWDASTPPVQVSGSNLVYHSVPNTNGADYIFDDLFPFTVGGLLVSTGSGAGQRFYDISLDFAGATNVDFFSINPDGSYLPDNGTFAVAAVPEPSTWAMMLLGFAGLGFMAYRRKNNKTAFRFA
jgi:PEP-CTERM motif